MIPSGAVAAWPRPLKRAPRRVLKAALAVVAALVLASELAGMVLLATLRLDARGATPLTVIRYGYYYADRPAVRRRVLRSCALALVGVLAAAGLSFLPRRRSLHGEARFANRREIRAAGLFGEHGILLGRLGRRYPR